jgi:stage V sporulation protein B
MSSPAGGVGEDAGRAFEAQSPDPNAARTAGRGGLAIAGAKVSFIVFGFAQQLVLPWLLGVDGYGAVSRVFAIVGIVNNIVVATSLQGVSRAVASAPAGSADAAFAATLRIHAVLALVISTAFALLAGAIASAVGAPHIATPLRMVAAVVLLYGVYAPLVGNLNARRRFLEQAGLDVVYSVLRASAVCGGAYFFLKFQFDGIVGAIAGFIAAAALIVPAALSRTGIGKRGQGAPTTRDYLGFLGPLALGQVSLNLLMQTDFMLLSRFAGQAADARSLGKDAADTVIGVYRGVQLFAFLPYQMLMSISFVLFPMLASAHAERDRAAVTRYTRTGVRLAMLVTGLMAGSISALAPHVLRFAFPVVISEQGGTPLRILSLGMGAFALLGIFCAALTSLGRERVSAALTFGAVLLVFAGCSVFVPDAGLGPPMLLRTAIATAGALTVTAILATFFLRQVAGAFLPIATLTRVLVAVGASIALGSRLPWLGKLLVLPEVGLVAVLYVLVLIATRELTRADLGLVRSALGRR